MKKIIEVIPREREFRVEFDKYQFHGRFQAGDYEASEDLIQVARSHAAIIFYAAFVEGFPSYSRAMTRLVIEASCGLREIVPGIRIPKGEVNAHVKEFRLHVLPPHWDRALKIRVYGLRGISKNIYINTSI